MVQDLVIPRLQSTEVHVSAPQHRMPKRSDNLMNTSPGQLGVQYTEVMPQSFHSNGDLFFFFFNKVPFKYIVDPEVLNLINHPAYEPHLTTRIGPAQYSRDGWSIPPAGRRANHLQLIFHKNICITRETRTQTHKM